MASHIKTSSERSFQDRFVMEMKRYKWDAPDFLDGNKQRVTVSDLINHWRSELNRINADQLEGVKLTDNEFSQVMAKVKQIENSYEAAKLLAMEGSIGKIDGIYRDDDPRITRKQITLTILKKASVRGGESSYKIAREVVSENKNRFDIILLINGLPLINIEQKRADKDINAAFNQFKRYYRDGEYIHNFMAFSQMMVIISEVTTRYFATPKSIDAFNKSFIFQWADKNNRPINDWQEVVSEFLMIPMAHQLVGDYLIIEEALNEEDRKHMIMRPYQVYALQAVEKAAIGGDNNGVAHGGYVWHTTGSGKTITSFKTALFLSTRLNFDKVVFLVDRRELDQKTSENFMAYAAYEAVSVDDTKYTHNLRKQMLSSKSGIIVTTIFKLNILVKGLLENNDHELADKKIVFIIDEAHRTTMGNIMGNITKYFRKNSLFYGFTGTPLFDQNEVTGMINEKSEVIDTTQKLFGPELHKYTIDQAIADGNVLGFNVNYINTGEFINHDDLREKLIDKKLEENKNQSRREIAQKVSSLDRVEVEKEAFKNKILVYQDETHIPRVVTDILENWDFQSQKKHFNAILTVAYKERVIAYYKEFKKQLSNQDYKINIAITFSFGVDEEKDDLPVDLIESMFKDYAKFTNIEFYYGDKTKGEDAYYEDLVDRSTRGGSGRNPKNIDLIIVADQMLTGYDNKYLNTLYVDRRLKKQGLIQAYSRTNRLYGKNKEFGSIINFIFPAITEEEVKTALKLYGSGGSSSRAIVEHYSTAVEKLNIKISEMKKTLDDPTEWADIKDDENNKELFLLSFNDANEQLRLVTQYYEYEWDDNNFGLTEDDWFRYVGAYKNLNDRSGTVDPIIINELEGKTNITRTQIIDANYILNLIDSQVKSKKGVKIVDDEILRIIYEEITELSNMGEDEQAKLIKEFVETELIKGNLSNKIKFDEQFDKWKQRKMVNEVEDFAKKWGIDDKILYKSVEQFSIIKEDQIPYIDELSESIDFEDAENKKAGNHLNHVMTLINKELPEWLIETKKKYDR